MPCARYSLRVLKMALLAMVPVCVFDIDTYLASDSC